MKRAIIVDDVENARQALRQDLADYCPEVEVIAEAGSVVEGARTIKKENPDLLFLDISLGDGTGFDLLEIIGEPDFQVIFTTSSDEHAIRAFRFSAVDYLLKPIDPSELQEAVKKAIETTPQESINLLQTNLKEKPKQIALGGQEKIQVVKIEDIIRCESQGSYTFFYLKSGEEILVTKTLKEYEQLLSQHDFIRVHQSHLVNLNFIKTFIKSDGGYLILTDKSEVPVSSRKKSVLLKFLSEMG